MVQWVRAGHKLMILSLTDGSAGHQNMTRETLAKRRSQEALAAARLLDAKIEIWKTPDGELEVSLALRNMLIRNIRQYAPDLIVTHRPADYHPDHRATAQLVQDATYLLQVPNVVTDVPPLDKIPPVLLAADRFTYPRPFRADWVVDTTPHIDAIVELLHCHRSQVYEWLPHTQSVTAPEHGRRDWLREWYAQRPMHIAKKYAAAGVVYAEAFEISEYGGKFSAEEYSLSETS